MTLRHAILPLALLLSSIAASASGPQVRWLETVHNFGAFDENDGKVTATMQFVNDGDAPLIIQAARATCGCTTPAWSRTPIEPGDTGMVQITYNPAGRPGRFEKKVYVDFNTPSKRSTLLIKGSVIGASNTVRSRFPVEAGPLRLRVKSIPFGEVTRGKGKTFYFEAYNISPDTLRPRWTDLPSYITVSSSLDDVLPGENIAYTVQLVADRVPDYGVVTGTASFLPDPDGQPDLSVPVDMVAIVQEDFSRLTPGERLKAPVMRLNENTLDFGDVNTSTGPVTRYVTVSNLGKSPLLIRRIQASDPGITVKASSTKVKPGKTATIEVSVSPEAFPDRQLINSRLTVIANDPVDPTLTLRLIGNYND